MKFIFVVALLLPLAQPAFARGSMCEAPAVEITQCTADAWLAFYPFVSVCRNGADYTLMMDAGVGRLPSASAALRSETETAVIFSTTAEEMDGTKFTYVKSEKRKGILSYPVFGGDADLSYTCTNLAE